MITESVPSALAGERLDRIVALIGDVSRAEAAATIAAGGVRVDGEPAASGKVRLQEGQTVEVDPAAIPEPPMPSADAAVEFGVVYEDDTVIVVDKPAGLVVHPGAGNMD
jgi:23S rRNA pseudouridine1911/1915/1917 synthase